MAAVWTDSSVLVAATAPKAAGRSATALAKARRSSWVERDDGTALFHRDWGQGKPIVFVHSWAVNSDMWAYQMMPLVRAGYRCIAHDRRGHGRSSDPGRGYDYDTLSDDLAALIETLDLHDVTLVGHSMGCGEILRYCTRHGASRLRRIALLAPVAPFMLKTTDNPDGIDNAFFQAARTAWQRDLPRWIAENTAPFFTPDTSPQIAQWCVNMLLQASLQAIVESSVAAAETDFRAELTRIATPALVIHGTADVSAPLALTGQRVAKLIPGSELRVYEGAPHGLFVTHLERINADLLRFVHG
jgi:pimeloyl-ACP methyl ester carboxylesterase